MNYPLFYSLIIIITIVYTIIFYRNVIVNGNILIPLYLLLFFASFVIAPAILVAFSALFFETTAGFYINFERAGEALIIVLVYFIPFLMLSFKRNRKLSTEVSYNVKNDLFIDFPIGFFLSSIPFLLSVTYPSLNVYLRPFSLLVACRILIEKKRGLYLMLGYILPVLTEFSLVAPGLWGFVAIALLFLSIVFQFKKLSIRGSLLLISLSTLGLIILNAYKLVLRGSTDSLNPYAFFVRINSLQILINVISYIKEFDYFQKVKDSILVTAILPQFFTGIEVRDISNEFGHEIHVLQENDFTTIVNPTHIAELYYNMGPFGVFLGGLIIAITLSGLTKITKSSKKDLVILGFLIFYSFANFERTFTYLIAGIVRGIYVWVVYLHIFYIFRHQTVIKTELSTQR